MERKFQNEATIRELRAKLSTLEEEHERDRQELSSLRHQNASLDTRVHEQEKLANQLKLKLAVTEQEVKDKEAVMQRTSDLLGTEQNYKVWSPALILVISSIKYYKYCIRKNMKMSLNGKSGTLPNWNPQLRLLLMN
jgi:predicted RNase H-like nuclease (RuvC/YqgF family)